MTCPTLTLKLTLLIVTVFLFTACSEQANDPVATVKPTMSSRAGDVTAARIIAADNEPGNWLSHGRTYDEQRFSPLNAINRENVNRLGLAWETPANSMRGLEATPIIVDGVMYTTSTWSRVMALDAATGELLWEYDPEVKRSWAKKLCCDVVNRGVAVWDGKVYA